jgi:hypothetical protein
MENNTLSNGVFIHLRNVYMSYFNLHANDIL